MRGSFPKTVTVKGIPGISATIYRQRQTKRGAKYTSYTLAYHLLGKLKRETFADLGNAVEAGKDAIQRIANGEQAVLELKNRDREIYQRAVDILAPLNIELDVAARECVDVRSILNGIATPTEAALSFVKHHGKEQLPRISVAEAVKKCLAQARADGKSKGWIHQLEQYLNKLANDLNCNVSELTPSIVSQYLTAMVASERTKKNCRDILAFFNRWLVLHGYLARGADLLEGVQRYSKKTGTIQIFTPAEMVKLIQNAEEQLLPYLVIGAFAGLRGTEIQRLDWSEIDLQDGFIEVKAEKSKTEVRRLVPIKSNLAAWLKQCQKKSGPVCEVKSIWNRFTNLVRCINNQLPEGSPDSVWIKWKRNGLRHSYISYRVAECADVARVADESGNSPAVIKANYLKRVKPDQAKEWFNIVPTGTANQTGKTAELPKAVAA